MAVLLLLTLSGAVAGAQPWSSDSGLDELRARLDAQAAEISALRARLDQQPHGANLPASQSFNTHPLNALHHHGVANPGQSLYAPAAYAPPNVTYGRLPPASYPDCYCGPDLYRVPVVTDEPWCGCGDDVPPSLRKLNFYLDYDRGLVIRPVNPHTHPFELKFNACIQFRHTGFARDVDTFTDNAGQTFEVDNRNVFEIERGRLVFSGYAVDPRLTYFLQLDGDTDGGHGVDFFDYWWAWQFTDDFRLQFGKRKVPASRQWILTARNTRFVDRPMANDFFRPDRTVGIFGIGNMGELSRYEFMIGNGFNTTNLPNSRTDDQFAFAYSQYYDPLGDYGPQIVDWDDTPEPLVRIGHSFVYAPTAEDALGTPQGEADFLRLTDGTVLSDTGALAPGVTVSSFDLYYYSLDAAVKYRGFSLNAEFFARWIQEIDADGPIPVADLFQRGYYVEGGYFLVPRKLDVNFRYSQIDGLFGNSSEYAAGANWFPLETYNLKLSIDATVLDGSPLNNTGSNVLLGDDGLLIRTQVQAFY
ncbi:MAG: porin [Planctomycetota bacterium]|nr:MAG: porin [Planctomycetota bacterium]